MLGLPTLALLLALAEKPGTVSSITIFPLPILLARQAAATRPPSFDGPRALRDVHRLVALGPRLPNTPAMRAQQDYIRAELKPTGCRLAEDAFTALTPRGPVPMKNLLCLFPGSSPNAATLVVTGHYDTKQIPGITFLGANDAGSSTAFLLELARTLPSRPHKNDILLVWLDGEEAFGEWSDSDSLYGSRHLAERWQREGFLPRIRALVNVDMIGDRHLTLERESYSTASLWTVLLSVARDLHLQRYFSSRDWPIEDDHVPFLKKGVPSLNLIDFDYGPDHSWWHTAADTPDKLSADSFNVTAALVLELLKRLDQ